MDILIGTKNPYKSAEMTSFLEGLKNIKIHYLDELKENIKVEEDQNSLKGNANKKAIEISKYTDYFVLASDGGVNIPGLGEKWDILKNQRTVGEDKTDQEKVNVLINLMKGLKGEGRKCTYQLALGLAKNGKSIWSFEDIYDNGYIIEKPSEIEIPIGRWMGFVWLYPQYQKVFTELNENQIKEVRKQGNKIKENLQKCINNL
jgi:XTP/dITP diphosphohydrolase